MIHAFILPSTQAFRLNQTRHHNPFESGDECRGVKDVLSLLEFKRGAVFSKGLIVFEQGDSLGVVEGAPEIGGHEDGGCTDEGSGEGRGVVEISLDDFYVFGDPVES